MFEELFGKASDLVQDAIAPIQASTTTLPAARPDST